MHPVAAASEAVPETFYTHHDQRGPTPHRSHPHVIHRELTTLDAGPGMNVGEIGTGSGYSSGLLSHIVGPDGTVTTLDVDRDLTRWTAYMHHERGVRNVRCYTADGTYGFPTRTVFDRIVAWCTPPLLPATWVDQVTDGGMILTPLPIAPVPRLTLVAKVRITGGAPEVEEVFPGGYIETTASAHTDVDNPARWVDWRSHIPAPAWVSVSWRAADDPLHTGARTTLDRLRTAGHTATYQREKLDWPAWRTFVASLHDPGLTMACLSPDVHVLGHSTPTTAAVIAPDGTITADAPDSPSLETLHGWLTAFEDLGRPAPHTYRPRLKQADDGWHMGVDLPA